MIDLELTDEQRLLQQTVREWAAREVAPRTRDLDRRHRFDSGIPCPRWRSGEDAAP